VDRGEASFQVPQIPSPEILKPEAAQQALNTSGALPVVTAPAPSHTSVTAGSAESSPPASAHPSPSLFAGTSNSEPSAPRFVSPAQLMQAANHSELRIAMDTDKLGAVELRAHLSGDEVGAAIAVERRDAHAVLAVELPALQQSLNEKQLRVEQVTLLHGSFTA